MNSNFLHNRRSAAPSGFRCGAPNALWAVATVCLLAPFSVGCHFGQQEVAVAHHPAFQQLEQGCFGYEPTVWRSLPGDCQQVVRMIPEEVVHVPEPAAPAEPVTPPEDELLDQPAQQDVPSDPLQGIPRIVQPMDDVETPEAAPKSDIPPAEPPKSEEPPVVQPLDVPPPPTPLTEPPAKQPAVEPSGKQTPAPGTGSAIPEPPIPESPKTFPRAYPPLSRSTPTLRPVLAQPVPQPASIAASELFRTVSQALEETSRPNRVAKQPVKKDAAAGLSKFISY